MMPVGAAGKKLDLSRLTDEEAKHVWEVIQRDFDLRKKEEDRLGELKTKLEKEDTKRELLGTQTRLTDSHCIRCLQPFKFLVNSKRQCLDCHLYTCKACSRYNKKERGWVCDSCRMARVLKIGTLEWYHENVRSRFKRFGSAKVMRSLYKRLNGEHDSQPDLRGHRDDDTHSMPEVHRVYDGHEEDGHDGHRYKGRKTKRLLPVHPLDFDMDSEYSARSSHQRSSSLDTMARRESAMAEADMALVFQQIMEEEGRKGRDSSRRKSLDKSTRSDEGLYFQPRMQRTRSLSKISSSGNTNGPQRHYYEVDTSDEEEGQNQAPQQPIPRRHSRASLQENLYQAPPPITELNKRMSAIESLLNRLEQKMTVPPEPCAPKPVTVVQLEEEKLRKKLGELGSFIDKGLSSEEDEAKRRPSAAREASARSSARGSIATVSPPPLEGLLSSSGDEIPSEAQKRSTAATLCDITTEVLRTINATENALSQFTPPKPKDTYSFTGTDVTQADEAYRDLEENVYITAGKSYDLEMRLRILEQNARSRYCGTTDSELSELEDKVAQAAAKVQSTESEVSDIENRIAALSAAGMPGDKTKRKASVTQPRRRLSHDFPISKILSSAQLISLFFS
ncbi:melanophilin-like [Megalops cyprinoides]|uniref:melanophilin-like n=1 Tax=Megalops cyprinoides TaxID=118141 RepID=UPI0018651965|nr:melanophilin-like [Megalops cyprinoides]